MQRFAAPGWRLLGAAGSWLVFAFSFTGLFQVAGTVIGLGGYCASGGPYVIEVECPSEVVLFAPLGIFGMFAAVGIALVWARDFGAPVIAWGWPILFVGLGLQFFAGAALGVGVVSNVIVGVLFVGMGAVPLVVALRVGALRTLLIGGHSVLGQPFLGAEARARVIPRRLPPAGDAEPVPVTAAHVALGLGVPLLAAAAGVALSLLALAAAAGGVAS